MSHRSNSIFTLNQTFSIEESSGFENKLSQIKSHLPRVNYSQLTFICEVKSVKITPNEQYIIIGLENGEIQQLNVHTPEEDIDSAHILKGHTAEVKCLCITNDNKTIISGSYDSLIMTWDIQKHTQKSILKGNEDKILSLALSKDNSLLISGSIDNIIRIWDLRTLLQRNVIRDIEENSYSISLTNDNKYILLGCSDNSIKIWNIKNHVEEFKLLGHKWPVYCIGLTSDGLYLISTGMDHTIQKWDLNTYTYVCTLVECDDTIYSLAITSDNLFVVYGKYNGDVCLVSIDGEMTEILINNYGSCINSVSISPSSKYIVSGTREGTLQISTISEDPEIKLLEGHTRRVFSLVISNDSQKIASASDDNNVIIWNIQDMILGHILQGHKGPVFSIIFTNDSKKCISGGQDQNIIIWDITKEKPLSNLKGHDETIYSLCITSDDKKLISASGDQTIRLWDLPTSTLEFIFRGHLEKITCITISSDNKFIISGSKDKTLIIWNIEEKIECKKLLGHDDEITSVILIANPTNNEPFLFRKGKYKNHREVTQTEICADTTVIVENTNRKNNNNEEKIVSSSLDKTIRVWNLYNFDQEYIFNCKKEIFNISAPQNSSYLFIQAERKYIKLFSLNDKQELLTLYENNGINALAISQDNEWIVYSVKNDIHLVKSPLTRDSSYTILPYTYSYIFKILIHRLLNNNKIQQRTIFSQYFICPHNISLLHILTYMSHSKMLRSVIKGGGKFFKARTGDTPLTIALSRKNKICAEILIKMLSSENYLSNPYIFEYIEGLLPILNKSSLPSLHLLYKAGFPKIESSALPRFGAFISEPPMLKMSSELLIDPNIFIINDKENKDGLTDWEIEFRKCKISLDLSPGSEQCIAFMRSLLNCKNLNIYKTKFIKSALIYKWRQVRWVLRVQALLYAFLVVSIILNTVYDRNNLIILSIAIFLNTIFLVNEIFKVVSDIASYFFNFWNVFDLFRILLLYTYASLTIKQNSNQQVEDILLVILTLALWSRFTGYLRIFDGIRYLNYVIIEVIKDMQSFLLILFLSNIGATIAFYSDSDHNNENFGNWLLSTYSISYGSWNFTENDPLEYVIFFISSLINALILLTLLISIITNTYSTITSILEIVDLQQLADIILEVDTIIFWNRSNGKKAFLMSCDVAGSNKKHQDFEDERKNVLRKMNEIDIKSKNNEKNIEKLNQCANNVLYAKNSDEDCNINDAILSIQNEFRAFKVDMKAEFKQINHDIQSVKKEIKKK